jgi:sugar/nucleoside kinase (ribokinase family)
MSDAMDVMERIGQHPGPRMSKRFAIIGDIIAERLDGTIVPGGSGAIALALARLGGRVTLRSAIGSDPEGEAVLAQLKRARIHPGLIDKAQETTASVTRDANGAVVERTAGAGIRRGALMDIYALFGHDALVLDTYDQPLRRFVSDLPAHTDGTVRMVSPLSHLDVAEATADELEIAMRFDAVVGTPAQLAALTGQESPTEALGDLFDRMPGAHLRAAIAITPDGLEIVARDTRVLRPIRDAVPDLLVPQVVAAVAWGFAHHLDWDAVATIAADPTSAAV